MRNKYSYNQIIAYLSIIYFVVLGIISAIMRVESVYTYMIQLGEKFLHRPPDRVVWIQRCFFGMLEYIPSAYSSLLHYYLIPDRFSAINIGVSLRMCL